MRSPFSALGALCASGCSIPIATAIGTLAVLLGASGCSLLIDDATFSGGQPDAGTTEDAGTEVDGGADADGGDEPADGGTDSGAACVPEVCDGMDNDCDGVPDNGAGLACGSAPGVTSVACVLGSCTAEMCASGVHDCDGEFSNGCEATLSNLDHCRFCGDRCGWACRTDGCFDALQLIDVGEAHACVGTADGRVACWGSNSNGQLGDGTTMNRSAPVFVQGLPTGTVDSVDVGDRHSCAVISGTAYCWGLNSSGQLGDGTTTTRTRAVRVRTFGSGAVASIAAGYAHTCAITTSNRVYCWGENGNNELGDGSTTDRNEPAFTSVLSDAVAIDTGDAHTCAINASGAVLCWGRNANGQVGDGTITGRSRPTATSITTGASALGLGNSASCAVVSNEARCWGAGVRTPTLIAGLSDVVDVDDGERHRCASTSGGRLYCWGNNSTGQVGDSTTDYRATPVEIVLPRDGAAAIAAGGNAGDGSGTSCAVSVGGGVSCWGANLYGQIGDGSMADRHVPTVTVAPSG